MAPIVTEYSDKPLAFILVFAFISIFTVDFIKVLESEERYDDSKSPEGSPLQPKEVELSRAAAGSSPEKQEEEGEQRIHWCGEYYGRREKACNIKWSMAVIMKGLKNMIEIRTI